MLPRRLQCLLAMGLNLLLPVLALADDAPPADGRLSGYRTSLAPPPASTSLTWLALIGLGIVGLGILFLSSRRTHLD